MTGRSAPRLVRRNYGRNHGYKIDGVKAPGVTTALGIMDKPALVNWAANEAATYAADHWDELAQLGPVERFQTISKAHRNRVRSASLRGTEIHSLAEKVSHGEAVTVPDEHRGPVEACARWLDEWEIEPIATETPLGHSQHRYGGTADMWATIGKRDGARALIDLKTGKGVYDETALQLAAYRYADLCTFGLTETTTPEVDLVYVAHVLPDTVRMLPIVADEQVFRSFLYALTLWRARESWREWPLVGAAVSPEGGDQ